MCSGGNGLTDSPCLCRKVFAGGGEGEFAVLDTFSTDEPVGQGLEGRGFASHDEDFQAVVMVEMDVESGNDGLAVVVLEGGQRFLHMPGMVVIDEGDSTCVFYVAVLMAVFDEAVAHHVGDGQGTIAIAFLFNHPVEETQEVLGEGDAEAGYAVGVGSAHGLK